MAAEQSTSRLTTFLFLLARDHVPFGDLEELLEGTNAEHVDGQPDLEELNLHQARAARELAERILDHAETK